MRPHTDADRKIFFRIGFFEFQIKVAGGFFLLPVSQKIELHFTVSGAKRIQAFRALIAIQKKRDKALCGNGFSGGVAAAQQDMSILYQKFLLII